MKSVLILLLAAAPLAPLHGQIVGAPPLPGGAPASEASLVVVRPADAGSFDLGFAAGFRRTGRVGLAARLAHTGGRGHQSSATLGAFGALPELAGVRAAFSAGLGVDTGKRGVFLPFGIDLARSYAPGGRETTPFLHLGASLDGMRPFGGHAGDLVPVAEAGADVRVGARWSVRAGLGTKDGGRLAIGMAYGR